MSSETIEDPDEPTSSRRRVGCADKDWVPADGKRATKAKTFSVENIQQRDWIKSIIPAANRACMSNDEIFFVFGDFFTAHGIDLKDLVFSSTTISEVRTEADAENAADLKVTT